MQIISSKEFRDHQKKYFELAKDEVVVITRTNNKKFILVDVSDRDLLTKEEYDALEQGLREAKEGKITKIEDIHNIWESIM